MRYRISNAGRICWDAAGNIGTFFRSAVGPYLFAALLVLALFGVYVNGQQHERHERCMLTNERFENLGKAFDTVIKPPPGVKLPPDRQKQLDNALTILHQGTDPVVCP